MKEKILEFVKNTEYREALGLPEDITEDYRMLAQGEYNINYLFTHPLTGEEMVLRVNAGSQMHLDRQIEYESHALKLLECSGRTPKLYYTDGSKRYIDSGILVMGFLPGEYPHYDNREEMDSVMACLADIHAVPVPESEVIYGEPEGVPRDTVKLIAPADPAAAILDECEAMVRTYMESPLGYEDVKRRLRCLLDRAHRIAESSECEPSGGDFRCCINTELNSTNFLAEELKDGGCYVRLVDWEKPLYGDPAQDLGHFLAPTTTFWKTDVIFDQETTDGFIQDYTEAAGGRFNTEGLKERTLAFIPVTCLRGLTWCAMAWVQYHQADKMLINESTRIKLDQYLSDMFIADIEQRVKTAQRG